MEATTSPFACSNLCWESLLSNIIRKKKKKMVTEGRARVKVYSVLLTVKVGATRVCWVDFNVFISKTEIIILTLLICFEDKRIFFKKLHVRKCF